MKQTLRVFLLLLSLLVFQEGYAQEKRTIQGSVMDDDGLPAIAVVIRNTDEKGEVYGITDNDGKFKFVVGASCKALHFSGMGYASKAVKLNNRQTLSVVISFDTQMLSEIVVVAKKVVDKFMPEPTDIEISGNYYIVRPKIKIPRELFTDDSRIVVQPMLMNQTRKMSRLFRPAVVSGRKFGIMLDRMLEFDPGRDPLLPYVQPVARVEDNMVLAYKDSLYLDSPSDECYCDIYMYQVKYQKVTYKDTATIAKGVVNPMKFFTYNVGGTRFTDEKYMPKPELQRLGDKGRINLTFLVNSHRIDDADVTNATELEKMRQRLAEIDNDEHSNFLSFSVTGISSPEGPYDKNQALAERRTRSACDRIFSFLKPETVRAMRDSTETKAVVEPWKSVVTLMEKDSLPTDKLKDIISRYPRDMDGQFWLIARLPEYRDVIRDYLPKLRRVEYSFGYSVLRILKDDEVRALYREGRKQLTPYEYWRMYQLAQSDDEREEISRKAFCLYPKFLLMANELAVRMIEKKTPDSGLLAPFITAQAPVEMLCNQSVALLEEKDYGLADSVASLMPDNEQTRELKAIISAYKGNYAKAYEYFAPQGGINEVALLLALKRNEEALEKIEELPESALTFYLKATACNRLDKLMEAYAYLKRAFNEDSELRKMARTDGDVIDLLEGIENEEHMKAEKMNQGLNKDEKE